ncbi:hypothetical protein BN1723_020563, partial [Verticillium longisporum]
AVSLSHPEPHLSQLFPAPGRPVHGAAADDGPRRRGRQAAAGDHGRAAGQRRRQVQGAGAGAAAGRVRPLPGGREGQERAGDGEEARGVCAHRLERLCRRRD